MAVVLDMRLGCFSGVVYGVFKVTLGGMSVMRS
jgi:hypothetical protein